MMDDIKQKRAQAQRKKWKNNNPAGEEVVGSDKAPEEVKVEKEKEAERPKFQKPPIAPKKEDPFEVEVLMPAKPPRQKWQKHEPFKDEPPVQVPPPFQPLKPVGDNQSVQPQESERGVDPTPRPVAPEDEVLLSQMIEELQGVIIQGDG
jgi:hypothetical protein